MAMQVGESSSDDVMIDINTTPLIDVMLVLIIMLIITIPIQTHAVKLDMPQGPPPATDVPPEVVRLTLEADGSVLWNGAPVPDRAALEQRLQAAAALQPQPEIHLAPDKQVAYGTVAMVLAEVQRAGVAKLGIAGGEAY